MTHVSDARIERIDDLSRGMDSLQHIVRSKLVSRETTIGKT
jgi:hypothetical protein